MGSGMLEFEVLGMERQATKWIGVTAIGFVTHNRMALLREVGSDLMLSAAFQLHFYQSLSGRAL